MERSFLLDDAVTFLNHGSYGAMSKEVWDEFLYWQHQKNLQPVHFFGRIYPKAIEEAHVSHGIPYLTLSPLYRNHHHRQHHNHHHHHLYYDHHH